MLFATSLIVDLRFLSSKITLSFPFTVFASVFVSKVVSLFKSDAFLFVTLLVISVRLLKFDVWSCALSISSTLVKVIFVWFAPASKSVITSVLPLIVSFVPFDFRRLNWYISATTAIPSSSSTVVLVIWLDKLWLKVMLFSTSVIVDLRFLLSKITLSFAFTVFKSVFVSKVVSFCKSGAFLFATLLVISVRLLKFEVWPCTLSISSTLVNVTFVWFAPASESVITPVLPLLVSFVLFESNRLNWYISATAAIPLLPPTVVLVLWLDKLWFKVCFFSKSLSPFSLPVSKSSNLLKWLLMLEETLATVIFPYLLL